MRRKSNPRAEALAPTEVHDSTLLLIDYGMGYDLNRFSPLKQINKDNVKHLVPVWNYSYDDNRSEESQPLVYKGVLYVTTNSATMAIDAKTRQATLEDQGRIPAGDAAHRLLRDHQPRRRHL
jgi:glucose dehydrogenase